MGFAYAKLQLSNPRQPELNAVEVDALVDSGANWTCIPEHVRMQLQLGEAERREVTVADGSKQFVSYVGPLEIHFENRRSFGGAMVLGNQVLLGAISMQDMDVVIIPKDHKLVVNPENPNFAAGFIGGVRPVQ
jgi:clan AA aspartic protease